MSKPLAAFLIFTCLFTETAFAQPPVRKFDDPGSPPFKGYSYMPKVITVLFSISAEIAMVSKRCHSRMESGLAR
jgi:hypothetical protein